MAFNPELPNGSYSLTLSKPEHRAVAEQLVALWKSSKGAAWLQSSLMGMPFILQERHQWPEKLPTDGVLKVCIAHLHMCTVYEVDASTKHAMVRCAPCSPRPYRTL